MHRRHISCLLPLPLLVFSCCLPLSRSQFLLDSEQNARSSASPSTQVAREDQWLREIKVRLIKPAPLDVDTRRRHESYLNGIQLLFDSPSSTASIDNCTLDFRPSFAGSPEASTQADPRQRVGSLQLQISGLECQVLPLVRLSRLEQQNVTHLILRETGIRVISRLWFAQAHLDHLLRLDVISNRLLSEVPGHVFDGLTSLTCLSFVNNEALEYLDGQALAGLTHLQELIFVGNGRLWSSARFQGLLDATSVRILPNLVRLHVSGSRVSSRGEEEVGERGVQGEEARRSEGRSLDATLTAGPVSQGPVDKRHAGKRSGGNSAISFALLSVAATILLLLALAGLVLAFVYESTLKKLFTMVEDDFLHNYMYDAFVSYNVNDSEWIFNKLIPNLEEYDACDGRARVDSETESSAPSNRIKLCVYDRDFIAGRAISECITEAIKNSRKVILVISKNFIQR